MNTLNNYSRKMRQLKNLMKQGAITPTEAANIRTSLDQLQVGMTVDEQISAKKISSFVFATQVASAV